MARDVVVVTGGAQGIGRSIVERLIEDGCAVVVLDVSGEALAWLSDHADVARSVVGDAALDDVAQRATGAARSLGTLTGWVNNAAVFRDSWLHEAGGAAVAELVRLNLQPALAGCAAAVDAFRSADVPGSIVNVSSHQAQRPVRGALPYSTAKAALEGLTRSLAVDYGPWRVRANAVALGSIVTERLAYLRDSAADERERLDQQMADLHPLGRPGLAAEVADVVAYLLSERSSFLSGAVVPVDGGRSVQGPDPEVRVTPPSP